MNKKVILLTTALLFGFTCTVHAFSAEWDYKITKGAYNQNHKKLAPLTRELNKHFRTDKQKEKCASYMLKIIKEDFGLSEDEAISIIKEKKFYNSHNYNLEHILSKDDFCEESNVYERFLREMFLVNLRKNLKKECKVLTDSEIINTVYDIMQKPIERIKKKCNEFRFNESLTFNEYKDSNGKVYKSIKIEVNETIKFVTLAIKKKVKAKLFAKIMKSAVKISGVAVVGLCSWFYYKKYGLPTKKNFLDIGRGIKTYALSLFC